MNDKLFVYGTLMIPEVMEAVNRKKLNASDAILEGYARYRLRGRVYPGIIEAPNRSVKGRVYYGIDKDTLELLDAFEADEYRRVRVTVTGIDGAGISAYAYVITPAHSRLLTKQDWDLDSFVKKHLELYLRIIGG